jgi:hypothetical protein
MTQLVPYSDNYTWTPNVDTTKQLTSTGYATFKAGQTYIRSNLWLDPGFGVSTLAIEAGLFTTETLLATETPEIMTTEPTYASPSNGLGLYVSSLEPAIFVRE